MIERAPRRSRFCNSQWNADQVTQNQRQNSELQRNRKLGTDDVDHRLFISERPAKIQFCNICEPQPVANMQRLIEAILLFKVVDNLLIYKLSADLALAHTKLLQFLIDRAAGRQINNYKTKERDPKKCWDHQKNTT